MSDFICFDEGMASLIASGDGLPATCYFLLSTTPGSSFAKSNTLTVGVGEITGTGYTRQTQAAPTPVGESTTFAQMTWSTSSATNWPNNVASIVLVTTANNTGHAICAWNLIAGGTAVNMSSVNVTVNVTPSLTTTSP